MKKVTITVTRTFEVPDNYEALELPTGEVVLKIGEEKYLWPDLAYFQNDPIDPYERQSRLDEEDQAARALGVSGEWSEVDDHNAIYGDQELLVDDISITFEEK